MHNLEKSIARWRQTMMAAPAVSHETLDELKNHLREMVEQLIRSGMADPEAFEQAVAQLGGARMIGSEFRKLEQSTWLPVKLVIGFGLMLAVAMMIFVIAKLDAGRMNFLLAGHVFAVTLGYGTTFLVGALGVCFVARRCLLDFSPLRMRSLTRVTFLLGCVAAGLTAAGVILAMFWAKAEWGRYWAWDKKEVGALAVLVWQVCFLLAHWLSHVTIRGLLVISLLGNIVVGLGWFGPNLLHDGPQSYGIRNYALLLLAVVISNFAFFLIGLAPAGWLRLRKAS
jgi:hypothetical protein